MIEIKPTDKQIKEARLTAGNTVGLQGSITRGGGSPAGALGEILVRDLLDYRQANTAHYDLYTDQGVRIDVKTKRCTSAPKQYYECSIAAHGTKQDCDEYIFVRVLNNLQRAWILGRIPKDEYFAKAIRHKKGDKDSTGCGYCDPAKNAKGWTPLSNVCLIAGKCYSPGGKHTTGCGTCDPKKNGKGWSPVGGSKIVHYDFATNMQGFTATTASSGVGWTRDTKRTTSAPGALYYGNPSTHTYASGSSANSGTRTCEAR